MNEAVTKWALSLHGNAFFDNLFVFFSKLGKGGFVFWLLIVGYAIYYWFKKKDRYQAIITLAFFIFLFVAFIMTDYIIKPLVKESRPFVEFPEIITFMESHSYAVPDDYSFPSGHATAAFLALGYLMLIDKKSLFATVPLALLISFSRIYIGAHYLGDVLAGAGIGLALGILGYLLTSYIVKAFKAHREHKDETR